MEMHQIRYFLAAARERNFTKAANSCGVSAPSLLRAIRLLEGEFGGPLFNRERGNMHLTELGRIAAPHLEQILQEAEQAKSKAKTLLNLDQATLRIGMMCTIAPSHFVSLIEGFRARHPKIALEIVDASAHSLEASLHAGELEIAIYALPGDAPNERFHALPLFQEAMVIAVSAKHPLAKKKKVELASLNGESYLERINCEFGEYAERFFEEQAVEGKTVYRSDRDDWVLAMVAAGLGYGFLPETSARYPGVVARRIVEPEIWRTVNLVTVRGRPHSPAVGAFVREVMRTHWRGVDDMTRRPEKREMSDADQD